MESVVPEEITHELTQILSNLVLGDNEIRTNAEKAVNERLAQTPEVYLLALAQFAIVADTDVMRSFSLVLLRRLLFRPAPGAASHPPQHPHPHHPSARPPAALFDHLSAQTITTLERLLLHSLGQEPIPKVRRASVETVSDVANQSMARGRPWHALQSQCFAMAQGGPGGEGQQQQLALGRASAFGVFAGAPNLIMDLQPEAVLGILKRGLEDPESIEVRHAALRASVAYLESADAQQLSHAVPLLPPMLTTLAALAQALALSGPFPSQSPPSPASSTQSNYHHLSVFLAVLTPLCGTHPALFAPHLAALLQLLPPLILPPAVDCGPTPTAGRPFPSRSASSSGPSSASGSGSGSGSAFAFPPPPPAPAHKEDQDLDEAEEHDLRQTLRLSALEFMLTLTEARPGMVRRVPGWVDVLVRACLEAMGELDEGDAGAGDEAEALGAWLAEDPSANSSSADTDSPPALFEQSLDRLALAMGGRAVLPPAFQYIPSMLASYDWRVRHAGLMAIAAISEGTGKVMLEQLGKIVDGQLCTDLEEVIQERYHQQLFAVLIPALEDPEPRVHAHAAAALINFCEGVARDTLLPYLDAIVARLLKMLNPTASTDPTDPTDPSAVVETKRYVQEQAVTTLAMVADASEAMFGRHYAAIMPLLLNVLRNADGGEYRRLRVKAMECAGLVAIAVGKQTFRPDAPTLVELLIRIQKSPVDPADTQLGHYLIATWAKVCQAMGQEFEPYLPVVVPALLQTASAKPDVSVYDEDEEKAEEREGWETVIMEGQTLGIRTSALEEKCQAFETLVIYCSTLGPKFAPYVLQSLEVTLPALAFYYHDGVREAAAMLIPMLLAAGKASNNTLTAQMVSAAFNHLIASIRREHDSSFLSSLYKCLNDCIRVVGGPAALPKEYLDGIIDATKHQLQILADRRRGRANRVQNMNNGGVGAGAGVFGDEDKEEMALMEEVEEFVLEDMSKMLGGLDPSHPLLIAVSSVKDLACCTWDEEEDE
ncbi:hypothetical protein H0H92_004620 [Tricholoma furcatifolium]|nr:hypothetical protein H0H92_004620 [Tricholoma furcatifolium]